MAIVKFDQTKGSNVKNDDDEDSYADYKTKWFDALSDEPADYEEPSEHTILNYKIEAQASFEAEVKKYQNKLLKAPRNSDDGWINTVLQSGTSGDKMAATIVRIQNSPFYNLGLLNNLIGLTKPSKKHNCNKLCECLTELFLDDLLPDGRKLRTWPQHPFSILNSFTDGERKNRLIAWHYEAQLKESYANFVSALEILSKDTVEVNREKGVSTMHKLLSGHPELENVLLTTLINKLGDPSQKVVSHVVYCLTQLLRVHPNMKKVVMLEVEKILFRTNISVRTQYYAICFLSQFIFRDADFEIARYLIDVYFSFFKKCVALGNIDGRLMGVLLSGVKRAYPYSKMDPTILEKHLSTLYKLVHTTPFSVSLHALCLLEQVSSQCEDRFYCALYKKLLDSYLLSSSHQAIFINLMYKALSKDEESNRVIAFIKRLLQVCLNLPVGFLCGSLYMISQIINKRANLWLFKSKPHQVGKLEEFESDEDEVYTDADKIDNSVKREEDEKSHTGWSFVSSETKSKSKHTWYNWEARNPKYCKAETSVYYELLLLAKHCHPTVALFAQKLLNNELIVYSGDPLSDFTLIRFLDRFVFKNPKSITKDMGDKGTGPDPHLARRKYYKPSGIKAIGVSHPNYLRQQVENVPVDEVFLFRYLKDRFTRLDQASKETSDDEDDDLESIASNEFDEYLNQMVGTKKGQDDDLDFDAEIGDRLKQKAKSKKVQDEESEDDDDDDEDEEGDDMQASDDFSEEEAIDFDEEGDDVMAENENSISDGKFNLPKTSQGKRKRSKSGDIDGLFAPAEEFAELLEEAGNAKSGMAHTFSNPDNAADKQLNWEAKRDRWIRGADKRKQKFSKKSFPKKKFKK